MNRPRWPYVLLAFVLGFDAGHVVTRLLVTWALSREPAITVRVRVVCPDRSVRTFEGSGPIRADCQ